MSLKDITVGLKSFAGHAGRPGKRGGSLPRSGSASGGGALVREASQHLEPKVAKALVKAATYADKATGVKFEPESVQNVGSTTHIKGTATAADGSKSPYVLSDRQNMSGKSYIDHQALYVSGDRSKAIEAEKRFLQHAADTFRVAGGDSRLSSMYEGETFKP